MTSLRWESSSCVCVLPLLGRACVRACVKMFAWTVSSLLRMIDSPRQRQYGLCGYHRQTMSVCWVQERYEELQNAPCRGERVLAESRVVLVLGSGAGLRGSRFHACVGTKHTPYGPPCVLACLCLSVTRSRFVKVFTALARRRTNTLRELCLCVRADARGCCSLRTVFYTFRAPLQERCRAEGACGCALPGSALAGCSR